VAFSLLRTSVRYAKSYKIKGPNARPVTLLSLCFVIPLHAAGSDVAAAVMYGDNAALAKLIRERADVNAPQVDGATALHWAAYRGDKEAAALLIRAGANAGAESARAASRSDVELDLCGRALPGRSAVSPGKSAKI
jgi:ankyrin repeat protein